MREPDLLQFPPLMSLYVDNKLGMEETQLIKSLAAVRGDGTQKQVSSIWERLEIGIPMDLTFFVDPMILCRPEIRKYKFICKAAAHLKPFVHSLF